tara:strand:- start:90 stop:1037 length:948 start_codon:yes stop_codon:yes gene_type:complete
VFLKKFLLLFLSSVVLLNSFESFAARGGNQEVEPPREYTKRAKEMLDTLTKENWFSEIDPLSDSQQQEFKDMMRREDEFVYGQPRGMITINKRIPVSLKERQVIKIKIGHTYNSTVVVTDANGSPWSFETLSGISNSDVANINKVAPHILTVKPMRMWGETNLPIKLAGEQYPLTILFEVSEDEVYFNTDIVVDGLGDSESSQKAKSMMYYKNNLTVPPKLTVSPQKEMMLQFLTPEGYYRSELRDDYGEVVDERDFMAWKANGSLFVMTPHASYSPQPVDISSSSDGRHKLFEYVDTSVILMKKNNQIIMLYAR